jgi:hypothetical protein
MLNSTKMFKRRELPNRKLPGLTSASLQPKPPSSSKRSFVRKHASASCHTPEEAKVKSGLPSIVPQAQLNLSTSRFTASHYRPSSPSTKDRSVSCTLDLRSSAEIPSLKSSAEIPSFPEMPSLKDAAEIPRAKNSAGPAHRHRRTENSGKRTSQQLASTPYSENSPAASPQTPDLTLIGRIQGALHNRRTDVHEISSHAKLIESRRFIRKQKTASIAKALSPMQQASVDLKKGSFSAKQIAACRSVEFSPNASVLSELTNSVWPHKREASPSFVPTSKFYEMSRGFKLTKAMLTPTKPTRQEHFLSDSLKPQGPNSFAAPLVTSITPDRPSTLANMLHSRASPEAALPYEQMLADLGKLTKPIRMKRLSW